MVKIAFVVPVFIMVLMVNVFGPAMRAQGIDPLAKARSQTAILEHKINAAINALPKLKWDFWR
jgi:hypothetical protein